LENQDTPKAKIDWHSAFFDAIQAELKAYKNALRFSNEVPLTDKPLKIDLMIIKKRPKAVIPKKIAEFFLEWNVVEYKSPEDYFSVLDFHKTLAYTHLYTALNRKAVGKITLTIVESRHPRNVLKFLAENHMPVEEKYPGVYTVSGALFPIQIIESRRLPQEDFMWLTHLDKGIGPERLAQALRLQQGLYKNFESYFYALVMANQESLAELEANTMSHAAVAQIFEELGYNRKWEEQGIQQGIAIGEARGIRQGLQQGVKQGLQQGVKKGLQQGVKKGLQQGVKQGLQQGVKKGVKQGIHSTLRAIQGLKNHEPLERLATETGLPIKEIKKIQAELSDSGA
jgi:hypothetical protein